MANIEYKLKKLEPEFKEAKIVEFNNKILSKLNKFPAVMFDVHSKEDMDAVKKYYFQGLPSDHILGYTVPFSKLATLIPDLLNNVPHDVTYLCDLETEIFWKPDIKPNVLRFFQENQSMHDKVKKGIIEISSTHNPKEKLEKHKSLWDFIMKNRRILMLLLTSYINRQNAYHIDIPSAFGPLLFDKDHVDFLEECYILTRRLYHNGTNDIEQSGKLIGMYANLHTDFLAKIPNITEFLKMVERVAPKALIFKIFNLEDIRAKPSYKKTYNQLIHGIADLSQTLNMPTFFLSTHTAGYKANTKGIDVFCEPFYRDTNVAIEKKGWNQNTLRRIKDTNPNFMSGKVYDIQTGELITRQQFQDTCLDENGIRSPIEKLSKIHPASIRGMSDNSFREFSKMLLMESRNFEESELHDAIDKVNMNRINSKLSRWEGIGIIQ